MGVSGNREEVVIENFMLQQIREGEIRHYLTDLLIDFRILRDNGVGTYFWGVRGNGCGTDMLACNQLEKEMRQWRGGVRKGTAAMNMNYPLSWAHAHVNDSGGTSFATVYKFVVKEFDGTRCEGTIEQVSKEAIRLWLFEVEDAYAAGVL
jgi:hypothetical protein